MKASALMVQGTGSNVGKSIITAGLCRYFKNIGVDVAPFKSQNMALNSFATNDGDEIGRAQAVQARAAGLEPTKWMNPILLKPTSDRRSQLIVLGRPIDEVDAKAYHGRKDEMLAVIERAYTEISQKHELIIIEGAGSPAEVNLTSYDVANMAVAEIADAPVLIVSDIDRGGVFASLCGTLSLLPAPDRARVKGFVINKFRGDLEILRPGLDFLRERTGVPALGVVPFVKIRLENEDSLGIDNAPRAGGGLRICVIRLPRISNFTDFAPLEQIEGVALEYVDSAFDLGRPDAVIIPGTKNTIDDCDWLVKTGIGDVVVGLAKGGTPVVGVCGGLQILGREIADPDGAEGMMGRKIAGLGLLPLNTRLSTRKRVRQTSAVITGGARFLPGLEQDRIISGYEIHVGVTVKNGGGREFARFDDGTLDGWARADIPVFGTYLHGVFNDNDLRNSFLKGLAARQGKAAPADSDYNFNAHIDEVAAVLEENLDMKAIERLALSSQKEALSGV